MQQIPPVPVAPKSAPQIRIEQSNAATPPLPGAVKMIVNSLHISGAQMYSEADLLALTGFAAGRELSLADLYAMAAKIEQNYRRNGYFVAQAYLPAQDIQDGKVTIAVIEGRYGDIKVQNSSNLSDGLARNLLGGLETGDIVAKEPLEQRLLLLSDLPGLTIRSTLVPGGAAGASDLIVDIVPGARVSGSVDADNAGSRYTGQYRVGATLNFNEPFGVGDVASVRVLTSGDGLNYARAAYQMQLGKAKVGAAYSKLDYKLGKEFASLHARGTAEISSLYGSYPLIRSRNTNLYAQLGYDWKSYQDKIDSTLSVTDKKAHVLTAGLYGDHRDGFGGGGLSTYGFSWSNGTIDIETPAVRRIDALTARSNGSYNKLSLNAMRLQSVSDTLSLYASLNGQLASKNLDVSERMELGGMNAVRAYPEGETYGDQGYVLNLEARMLLPAWSDRAPGQLQLIGFADTGSVTLNKNPWSAGSNHRTLSGAGLGLSWSYNNNLTVKTYYAHKLGGADALSAPDKAGRFWIQAVKYF